MCHEIHSKKSNDICYIVVRYVSSRFYMLRGADFTTSINTSTKYFVSMGLLLPLLSERQNHPIHLWETQRFSISAFVCKSSRSALMTCNYNIVQIPFCEISEISTIIWKAFMCFPSINGLPYHHPVPETQNIAKSISNYSEFPAIHPSKPSGITTDKNIYYRG